MRLVTITDDDGATRLGALDPDGAVADVGSHAPALPPDVGSLLATAGAMDAAAAAIAGAPRLDPGTVTLAAPVPRPPAFLAIGHNYALHVAESGSPIPEHPVFFTKHGSCVIGPGAAIEVPTASEMVDYEGELAFVIGRRCRHVPAGRAHEVIAGYTVCNDVSVRDWQWRTPTWIMGKGFDTHGPLGPALVTSDELGDPADGWRLRTWVNGDLRQDGRTDDLIFSIPQMVEFLTTAFTLEPGTVVSTGTPSGVGFAQTPPAWLRPGDTVRIEIEGLGTLENPVVAEPRPSTDNV